jgi:hypothetical protein
VLLDVFELVATFAYAQPAASYEPITQESARRFLVLPHPQEEDSILDPI